MIPQNTGYDFNWFCTIIHRCNNRHIGGDCSCSGFRGGNCCRAGHCFKGCRFCRLVVSVCWFHQHENQPRNSCQRYQHSCPQQQAVFPLHLFFRRLRLILLRYSGRINRFFSFFRNCLLLQSSAVGTGGLFRCQLRTAFFANHIRILLFYDKKIEQRQGRKSHPAAVRFLFPICSERLLYTIAL